MDAHRTFNLFDILQSPDESDFTPNIQATPVSTRDDFLCGLYTMIPPRRSEDMSLLTLVDTLKGQPADKNYITITGEQGKPPALMFNVYKKSAVRGPVKLFMPPSLLELAKAYIIKYNIQAGDRLFKGTPNSFGKAVSRAFKKKYNIDMTINTMRHYTASELYSNRSINLRDRQESARNMGHSLSMNMLYARVVPP